VSNLTLHAPSISAVVPAYNSELSLPELVRRLEPVLDSAATEYEMIIVDDGSRDGTWPVIQELARDHSWVKGVHLMRNYGQHNAVLCGIRLARNAVIVTLDDDLQHPPRRSPSCSRSSPTTRTWLYGAPAQETHGLWRDLASQVTKMALQSAMGAPIARKAGPFRAFRTEIRDAFAGYDGPYVSVDVLMTWGTTRFAAVEVRHDQRTLGKSNYTFRKLVVHAVNMITGFSTLPLQLASLIGFLLTLVGIGALIFVVVKYLIQGGECPAFPPRLDDRDLSESAALLARHHRRIPRAHACTDDAAPHLCGSRNDRGRSGAREPARMSYAKKARPGHGRPWLHGVQPGPCAAAGGRPSQGAEPVMAATAWKCRVDAWRRDFFSRRHS